MIILRSHHPEHPDDGFRSLADDGGLSSANVAHHPAYETVCVIQNFLLFPLKLRQTHMPETNVVIDVSSTTGVKADVES